MSTLEVARSCREILACLTRGEIDSAHTFIQRLLPTAPSDPNVLYVAGNVALAQGEEDRALVYYERAITIAPDFPAVLLNLGYLLRKKHRLRDARATLRRCVDLMPRDPHAWLNLTATYVNEGEPVAGESVAREALEHCPMSPDIRWNLGLLLLEQGSWEEGWQECVHRFETPNVRPPLYTTPGDPPKRLHSLDAMQKGHRVVCHGEQGLGDEILFASMLREFLTASHARGAEVVLDCHRRLRGVFARNFDVTLAPERTGEAAVVFDRPVDWVVAMGDLGIFFRSRASDFPLHNGYLLADPTRVAKIRDQLEEVAKGRPLVGIAWNGGTPRTHRRYRAIPLAQWRPLLRHDVCFVALEYRDCSSETTDLQRNHGLHVLNVPEFAMADDFEDVFALIASLDLVVTVPTTALHVAGSLGTRCLVAMHERAAWRECSPDQSLIWYPRTHERFLRSAESTDWSEPIRRVSEAVQRIFTGIDVHSECRGLPRDA